MPLKCRWTLGTQSTPRGAMEAVDADWQDLGHSPRRQLCIEEARIFKASAAVRLAPEEFVHLSDAVAHKSDLLGSRRGVSGTGLGWAFLHALAHHAGRSTPAVR